MPGGDFIHIVYAATPGTAVDILGGGPQAGRFEQREIRSQGRRSWRFTKMYSSCAGLPGSPPTQQPSLPKLGVRSDRIDRGAGLWDSRYGGTGVATQCILSG